MIKIKMLQDAKGADEGAILRPYTMDGVYTVSDDLGQAFVDGGEAEIFEDEKPTHRHKAAADKEAAEKAAADKEAAEKAAAGAPPIIGLPPLSK